MADEKKSFSDVLFSKKQATEKQSDALLAAAVERWSRQLATIPVGAQMHDHAMLTAQVSAHDYYFNTECFVKTAAAVSLYYDFDSLALGNDTYNIEAEGLGAKMIYGKNSMPTIDFRDPFIKGPADLAKIKTPDFAKAGRFPYQLEAIRLGATLGSNLGSFCAPFSLAVGLRSYPLLIRDMRKDPKFYDDLMTLIVDEVLVPYVLTMRDYCGVGMAMGADAWSAFPNVTPQMYQEHVLPWNLRLMAKAGEKGMAALAAGGADYCEERVERFDEGILHQCFDLASASLGGAPSIFLAMGRWQDYPLEAVRSYTKKWRDAGVTPSIMAGINARLLRDGPAEKIVDNVKRFVKAFGHDHALTIFLANIPADAPSEHVHAAVAAVHTYGRLPLAADLDKVKFTPPKRESFAEFVKKFA